MTRWQDRVWDGPAQLEKLRRRRERLYARLWCLVIFAAVYLSLWIGLG